MSENSAGIIPAGGKSERFDGVPKELLPLPAGGTPLYRAAYAMRDASSLRVITSPERCAMHMAYLGRNNVAASFYEAQETVGASILRALGGADRYLFSMPDTVFPVAAFKSDPGSPFVLWTFETDTPERFGLLVDGMVVDKPKDLVGSAWGLAAWSKDVAEMWARQGLTDHTEMWNAAIDEFGLTTAPLEYYHDFASWSDYAAFIRSF